jgi:thymidine kinase
MFQENFSEKRKNKGTVEVVCGSMFSGKTEELLRRLKRAEIARQRVLVVKPSIDTRYGEDYVVSHNENSVKAIPLKSSKEILALAMDKDVIGVDEAQFFDDGIVAVVNQLAKSGRRVIVAGLDMDFRGVPFGPMPALMAVAEYVTKVHAICTECGDLAQHSFRLSQEAQTVLLGEKDKYKPLCRSCFNEKTG